MPFTRPSLETLIKRNQADIESSLPGADAKLRRTNLGVLAKVISACTHGLYGYLAYIAEQILPDTAEKTYLDRHASLWLSVPRKAASYAVGQVVFNGTNGTLIPAGSVLIRADGLEYELDADATIAAGQAIASVTSVTAGQTGNADAATTLTMASPIAGIASNVIVHTTALTGGADEESDAELRARIIARIQQPPHGGADFDYIAWALEVPGVTRAWVYPQELGLGTVTVRFVRDEDANLIPDAAEVIAVYNYIEARRPVTVDLTVLAPVAVPLNFTIAATPNTATVKAAIEAELKDLIQRESKPNGTIYLSHIREAISLAAGENNYVMSAPNADVTTTVGNMTTFGVITWI